MSPVDLPKLIQSPAVFTPKFSLLPASQADMATINRSKKKQHFYSVLFSPINQHTLFFNVQT